MQGEDEESIRRQIDTATTEAKQRGYTPLLYVEPKGARSGYYERSRPEWLRLKRDLETRQDIRAVIVADLARASRDRIKALEFIEWLNARGIQFISLKESFDLSSASGRAMLGVLAVFNQFYRDDISERKKRQYAARDKSIYASNVHPFGLKRSGSYPNIQWQTTPDFDTVLELCELYLRGYGCPAIAEILNTRGRTWINRTGQRVAIKENTVHTALQAIERYKPFMPTQIYNEVIAMRARRTRSKLVLRKTESPPLLLRGLVRCSVCHALYTSATNIRKLASGETGYYKTYRHRVVNDCVKCRTQLRAEIVDAQIWSHLEWLDNLPSDQLDAIARDIAQPQKQPPPDYALRREKLERQLYTLVEMRAAGEIEQAEFIQSRDRLRAELANIPDAPPPVTVEYDFDTIRALLDNLSLTLQMSAEIDCAAANRALLGLFDAVEFDGKSIVRVVWRAPFESFNQS